MNHTRRTREHASPITVEVALWVLAALVALALRLPDLDAAPLNAPEAHEAMLAWQAAAGQGSPQGDYSPLLFAANALLFTVCGTSDSLARLWPALFGSALALTPLLLRPRVGRLAALAAGFYLALSPTALLASRQLDGAVVAAAGAMAFLGGLVRFLHTERRLWLALSAGGLALALTASPSAYGLLLALGVAWLTLTWAWPNGELRLARLGSPRVLRSMLELSGLAVLALSTGLGWNPSGFGATGDLLAAWLARFRPPPDPAPSPFTLVAIYEPFALIFGLIGLTWALQRRRRFGALLGLWAGLGTLLLTLMPGRSTLDLFCIVLPLAVLAGLAVEAVVRSLRTCGGPWLSGAPATKVPEVLYVLLVLVLWGHFYLMLARYAALGVSIDLWLASLSICLQALLGLTFALASTIRVALRGHAVGTGIALLAVTFSVGWGSAHARPADPRELLVRQPTAAGVRDLVQTLRDLSWRETGMPTRLPFTLQAAPDSVLAWYLRDFSAARRVEQLDPQHTGPVIVTSRPDPALPDAEYVGQDFPLRRTWDPTEISCLWHWPLRCDQALGWLLRRHTPSLPAADERAVLWLRGDWAAQ